MLDNQTDAPLEALLALLKTALNAEIGVPQDAAVATTHLWPITTGRLPVAAYPALAIWRTRETFLPRITGPHDQRVTLRIAYVLPPTPLDRLGVRWPLLRRAWEELTTYFLAGSHPSHEDGEDVLTAAGFIDFDVPGAVVDYGTAPADEDVLPRFEATITVTIRPTGADLDELEDLSLATEIHPAELDEDERPLVEEIHDPL